MNIVDMVSKALNGSIVSGYYLQRHQRYLEVSSSSEATAVIPNGNMV